MKKVFIIILNVVIALVGIYTALSFVGKKTRTENITIDTVWTGLSANKQFWKKLNINDDYTIVFDGEKCVIGRFIADPFEHKRKFTTKARFDINHYETKYESTYDCPDIYLCFDCFIKVLEKGKEYLAKYSSKCKEHNIIEYEQSNFDSYYSVIFSYHKEISDEYIYISLDDNTSFKFKSIEEIDNWIQKIEEFKKNEFVDVKSLFE